MHCWGIDHIKAVSMSKSMKQKGHNWNVCSAVARQLKWFAGVQIRNVASLGGNICTASPISDLNPLWIAAGSIFIVASADRGTRSIKANDFFVNYRKTKLLNDEVLTCISIPVTKDLEFFHEFKQSHRREDDIAIVNAGMRARFAISWEEETKYTCVEACLCFGGVGPIPVVARTAEDFIVGKEWGSDQVVKGAIDALMQDIVLNDTSPGGMADFRKSLVASFFFKFYTTVCAELARQDSTFSPSLGCLDLAVGKKFRNDSMSNAYYQCARGLQVYDAAMETAEVATRASRGAAITHRAADQQVSGEAIYGDDIELPASAAHGALVLSDRPHAKIISIDFSAACASKHVYGFFSAKDIPGCNNIGPVFKDEELFASKFVTSTGQFIGIIVASTRSLAKEAAKLVKVTYEDLPAIMTIEEAISANSYHTDERILQKDMPWEIGEKKYRDHENASSTDYIEGIKKIEGEIAIGGQEHFYLEPNNATVTPRENSEVMSVSSTQDPAKHQKMVAEALGICMHKVVCKTKRIGGGFGGKESRAIAVNVAAAVAAWNLGRTVRLCLDRDEDMMTTGHRHPFLGKYRALYQPNGKIIVAEILLYSNGGNSLDLSLPVMERAMFHADNCYDISSLTVKGIVCKTNTSSNTAFRGFGGPQGMMVAEALIDDVARNLCMSPEDVRKINLYKENDITHFRTKLESFKVPECFEACLRKCSERKADVLKFNKNNRWIKRGLAAIPTKFGISFTAKFMNQAGALIHIYTDGTVLVTHGGVEMGQGLHTKIAQIVAKELTISVNDVYIAETSTDKVANASPSAASACTDLYGAACQDACFQLNKRLEPFREKFGDFKKAVNAAYFERIDLSAHGFYITPDLSWDWTTKEGRPFNYFTYGAAFSEVEVDVLTGDSRVLRTDIVMDVGLPINPAIDVGQIEGGFVQGLGWCLLEELKWGDSAHPWARPGHLITRGPGSYKIPTADDIPREMNVTILRDSENPRAVHSSKAIGEPPFFLAASAFFAVKDAVHAARQEFGKSGDKFTIDLPATPERVRLACGDTILSQIDKKFQDRVISFRPFLSV